MNEPVAGFRLTGIELLDFKLNYPENPLPKKRSYDFKIHIKQQIDKDNKLVRVNPSVDVVMVDGEAQTNQASIKVSCVFELEEILSFTSDETGEVELPERLVTSLNSIAISTTRGVLFSELKGTFLHGIYLPVVDTSKFARK